MLIAPAVLLIASPFAAAQSRGASVAANDGQRSRGIRHFRPGAADFGSSNASTEQIGVGIIRFKTDAATAPSIDPATIPFLGKTIRSLGQ